MLEFFGRFHPVLVHLPIGILLIACAFLLISRNPRFAYLHPSVSVLLFLGMLSALFSCLTGYLLAQSGDYDGKLVNNHQWMGIGVAALSVILFIANRSTTTHRRIAPAISVVLIVTIAVTGHLGGSLTHGSDYLTAPLKQGGKTAVAIPPIPGIQEAFVYRDAVQPLFKNRCYSCHSSAKQKGKLRLDLEEYILKGGESGNTVLKGNADESEMIRRLLLPESDEDHMPPREKPQLSQNEIALLHWWIDNGASFNKKVKDLRQPGNIKPVLTALEKGTATTESRISDVPEKAVGPANEKAIRRLQDAGVMVVPVAQNSNFLSANFVNVRSLSDPVLDALKSVRDQLIWLKLENGSVTDATLKAIKGCRNLIRLSLNNTRITDKGLEELKVLEELRSLSLVGTKVSARGVAQLGRLKNLKSIYLYQTDVQRGDWKKLKEIFPRTDIDSGNYQVPTLAKDTTEVKPPPKKDD